MITGLDSIEGPELSPNAVFRIELDQCKTAYMSIRPSNFQNEERCVVVVNSEKFLSLWRNEPHSIHAEQSFGNTTTWKNDRKFMAAEKGFSFGKGNPVPLAEVVCRPTTQEVPIFENRLFLFKKIARIDTKNLIYSAFINGVTRTIWLLSHGAKVFPVECRYRDGAKLLSANAGYKPSDIVSLENLFT